MNRRFSAILVSGVFAVVACNQPNAVDPPVAEEITTSEPEAEPVAALSEADVLRVCKGGASFRNGAALGGIKARKAGEGMVRLSYTRDDGKPFAYDCIVEGAVGRFRMIDEAGPGTGPGNWSGSGSRTTFVIYPSEIEFTDDFFDGEPIVKRVKI